MGLDEIIDVVKDRFPKSAIDIYESLELLKETVSDTMDEMNDSMNELYYERDFESRNQLDNLLKHTYKYEQIIEDLMMKLEYEESITSETDEKETSNIPNYEDYLVDHKVEYNLYEDLKHKRPYGFRMGNDEVINISTWREMFVKTCEIFMDLDPTKFMEFEHKKKMNGNKKKYFSTNKDGMLIPILINGKIYVEGHGSSNGHRNRVLKVLNEFNYNINKFKIFLRADYSDIHK